MAIAGRAYPIKPWLSRSQLLYSGSGATTVLPPTASWSWAHNAPVLAFSIAAAQRGWVWHPQAPALGFAIAAAQRAWAWTHTAPVLAFASLATAKAWVWAPAAPTLAFAVAALTQAWNWAANPPGFSGVSITQLAIRFWRPGVKRRRSGISS